MTARHDAVRATIIGAGIGGLAAGLALARRGTAARILEQAPELGEVGAGLQITPNGSAVLAALGLGPALARIGAAARWLELRDYRRGGLTTRLDLATIGHSNPHPWLFVHRADLVALLSQAAAEAGVVVETGRQVVSVAQAGAGARLGFATGGQEEAPLVVGADGLHSVTRAAVLERAPEPAFTGQVAWRALVRAADVAPLAPDTVTLVLAPGRHLVLYPLRGGSLVNMVAVEERGEWVAEGWSQAADPAELARRFADFAPVYRALFEACEAVHLWGLFRHPVAARWSRGSVALLGDAAHPTLPFLAQGANLALEDAFVLARHLYGAKDLPSALEGYGVARRARAARVVAAASVNAWAYHLRWPPMRLAARLVLGLGGRLAPGAALARYRFIHGHDVTREEK